MTAPKTRRSGLALPEVFASLWTVGTEEKKTLRQAQGEIKWGRRGRLPPTKTEIVSFLVGAVPRRGGRTDLLQNDVERKWRVTKRDTALQERQLPIILVKLHRAAETLIEIDCEFESMRLDERNR